MLITKPAPNEYLLPPEPYQYDIQLCRWLLWSIGYEPTDEEVDVLARYLPSVVEVLIEHHKPFPKVAPKAKIPDVVKTK